MSKRGADCRKTPWPPLGGGSARRRWGRELHAGTKVSGKGEALSLRPFGPPPSQREAFLSSPVKNLTSSSSCTSFYRFAIFARFANDSCGFLQRKVPYRGTIFHIRKPALHQRSALRNFDFAYTAPRYKQLPQWSKPPPHGTLRMTKFVCSAPRLYPARARHPQAAGPACKEENYGKKCDRRSVRRPDFRHQRKPGRCL